MGSEIVGSLRVVLGLDSANFESGARKARSEATRTAKSIEGSFGGLKSMLGGLAVGVGIGGITELAKQSLEYASSLGEVSQQLGVTSRGLQELRYAGSQVGIETEDMDKALAKLTLSIGKAAGGSREQAQTFRDLGISIRDASGQLRTADQIIPQLADALSRIKDPATRARIEVELFGRAGQKLDTLLTQGSAGLKTFAADAERLGLVISPELINRADDAADKMATLQKVLSINISAVVAQNAGAISALAQTLIEAAGAVGGFIQKWSNVAALGNLRTGGQASRDAVTTLMGTAAGRKSFLDDINAQIAGQQRLIALGKVKEQVSGTHLGVTLYRERAATAAEMNKLKVDLQHLVNTKDSIRKVMAAAGAADQVAVRLPQTPTIIDTAGSKARAAKSDVDALRKSLGEFKLDLTPLADFTSTGASEMLKEIDRKRIEAQQEARGPLGPIVDRMTEESQQQQEEFNQRKYEMEANNIQQLAGLYETLFTQGTKGFLHSLLQIGTQVLSQLAAQLTTSLFNGGGGGGGGLFGSILGGLGSIFGGGGGGGGGGLGSILSSAGSMKLPGFATGGSFEVGGTGGIDSKLVSLRLTPGELVNVQKPGANDGGRRVINNFDMRGALVDRDVYADIQRMGERAANEGAARAVSTIDRRERSTMGSRR